MSGLIGKVGSRSGVISRTEIYYEEGEWTPVLANHASSGTTVSGTANGFYTRIGRSVFISGRFACSNLNSATGDLILRGLPFTVKNSTGCDSAFSIGYGAGLSMTAGETVVWNVQKGLTIAYAMDWSATAGQGFFHCSQFSASGVFTWAGHYFI